MNFKSKKWTIPLLVVFIFLIVGASLVVSLGTEFWKQDFKSRFLGTFSQNPFRKQSQIKVSLVDSKINLSFDLIDEDKPEFANFVANWFGTEEEIQQSSLPAEIKTLSLGVDEKMKTILSQNLPANLRVTVTEKSLIFSSNIVPGLQNALIKSDYDFATGSSKLNAQFTDSSKYQIRIDNPADLANYATSSGILTTSSKIEGLFQTLPKVATIELNVNGKNISGRIVLK